MWLPKLAACLTLWTAWISALHANFTFPSYPGMMEMTGRFQEFMVKFSKTYNSQEEMIYRFKVFAQNMETSRILQDTEMGTAQYGITPFSDLTESEFAKNICTPALRPGPFGPTEPRRNFATAPRFCDWRKKGLSPVKSQGECCSCWAFAAVSNIEALWKIHRNVNCSLSVQELVDCTYPSRRGCEGGYVWDALHYVFNKSGLSSSRLYPYVGKDQRCQKPKGRKLTKIDGYSVLPRDERYIANFVATQGPATALMNTKILQHYKTGIIQRSEGSCNPNWLDHAVLIVGFGEGKIRRGTWSGPYWIIQNTWGKEWGEQGYFRMERDSNTCGLPSMSQQLSSKTWEERSRLSVLDDGCVHLSVFKTTALEHSVPLIFKLLQPGALQGLPAAFDFFLLSYSWFL
ncbi:LOW QUALITY PROTEIN: cathepsin W [Pituophis catenifer annectens]|uniref:LOW QUALITY PROTEIN: cathepsin W n=1 Tax=Pituophis catenifer annectens TaxID=94852 RepID=UPI003991332C